MSNAHTIILDSSQSKFGCILHRIVGIASLWRVDYRFMNNAYIVEKLENNLLGYNLGRLDIGNVLVFINTSGTGSW